MLNQHDTHLDQEAQIDILRLGCLSVAVFDVVSLNIDTLRKKLRGVHEMEGIEFKGR